MKRKINKQKIDKCNDQKLGSVIHCLIQANIKNWEGKELYFDENTPIEKANKGVIESFQASKIRNAMITQINRIVHNGPVFHFRNYHNY